MNLKFKIQGKLDQKLFINAYVEEIYELEQVRTSTEWSRTNLDAKYEK